MTGNRIIDAILGLLTLLTTAGALGVFIYTEVVYQRPPVDDSVEKQNMMTDIAASESVPAVALGKITLNIQADRPSSRLRFLDVEASVVPFNSAAAARMEANKKQITDSFIDVASRMSPEELGSISGRILLESRLKKRIEIITGPQSVKEILFTSFVIQ